MYIVADMFKLHQLFAYDLDPFENILRYSVIKLLKVTCFVVTTACFSKKIVKVLGIVRTLS